mgnify:CR=1 FL=1
MEVINKTFAGSPRTVRCGCICAANVPRAAVFDEGFTYAGCASVCKAGDASIYNNNWTSAVSQG